MTAAARAIARNLGWMLASRGVLALLSLVYLAIATRTLGVTHFGRFALIMGASQALAIFVGFQTWQIIVQYGTTHLAARDDDRLGRLVRACWLLDAASAAVGISLAAIVIWNWGETLGVKPSHMRATMIFTTVQLLSIRSTALGVLRLRDQFSLAALADSVTPVARLLGAVVAAVFMPTITGFLLAWGLAEVLTALAYWTIMRRTGDIALFRRRPGCVGDVVRSHPGILRFALSTNANSTLGLSSKQIPLLMVGGALGSAAAGAFQLALQVAQGLTKLSQLLGRAAFPEIVRSINSGGVQRLGRLIGRSLLASSLVASAVFGIILLGGRPVLTLMGGPEFAHSYPILVWLAAAGCIDLVTVAFEPLLMAAHRAGTTFLVRLAGTGVLLALGMLLVPHLGVIGVAAAVLANSLLIAGCLGIATGRMVRPRALADRTAG